MHKNLMLRGAKGGVRYGVKRLLIGGFNLLFLGMDYHFFHQVRFLILRMLGVQAKSYPRIGESFYLMSGRSLVFGDNCVVGHFWEIFDWSPIVIGDNLLASNRLTLVSATHDPISYEPLPGPIIIGDNVWIGINVTIVGPVKIGDNAVIGAGALVIRDVPDNAIVAGVPARVIRYK